MVVVLPRRQQVEDADSQKLREFLILDDHLTFRNVAATVLLETVELGGEEDEGGDAAGTEISRNPNYFAALWS
jgi:hypothetical protein